MSERTVRKVLLAGHAGLDKRTVAARLQTFLEGEQGRPDWINRVACEELDDALEEIGEPTSRQMLEVRSQARLRESWARGWQRLVEKLNDSKPRCAIVSVHFVLADKSLRVVPAILNDIAGWKPDLVVTLIDDVYAIKRRIQAKSYDFSFQQLYDWRTIEGTFADQVALLASERKATRGTGGERRKALTDSVVLSVNSPIRTLARLIAQPELTRVYASFPISSTRGDPQKKAAIDRFRRQLHEHFVVFDPLAIDELPLLGCEPGEGETSRFPPGVRGASAPGSCGPARWDSRFTDGTVENGLAPLLPAQDTIELHSGGSAPFYPLEFPYREIESLKYGDVSQEETTVHDQLTVRDLRLVEQADYLVVYRPWWDGHLTGGVRREIVHAKEGCRPPRDVYAYVANDRAPAKGLEEKIRFPYSDEGEFWSALQKLAAQSSGHTRFVYY